MIFKRFLLSTPKISQDIQICTIFQYLQDMESLLDNFSSAFSVSSDPNDTASPHPRLSQYKEKPSNVPDQTTRRKRMLEQQKRKRLNVANYSRKLADGVLNEEDVENDDGNEEMEFMDYKEKRKRFNPYAYQLMLSEWLVDVPEDLTSEWLMVVCPHGKRNLVIASNGKTSAYTKSGFRVNQFTSLLPGGSPDTLRPAEYTILDCIFNEVSNTFYVLDIMCWRGHPVYDSETEFRFYWLQTKLQEEQELNTRSSSNPYKFIGLTFVACTPEQIKTAIEGTSPPEVDGLLFYHKRTHYVQRRTPLVGWLKVHMVPEILGIDIDPVLTTRVPRVDRMALIKNNLELKNTTDDKTAEEKAEYERNKKLEDQMEVDKINQGRRKKEGKSSSRCDSDSRKEELDENCSATPMDVTSKSRSRRKRKNKKEESMNVEDKTE